VSWLRRFGAFWYDFLVGDRWELLVGPIDALAGAAALAGAGLPGAVVGLVLVLGIVGVAGVSLWWAIR